MTTYDAHLLRRYLHVYLILFLSAFGLYVVIDGFSNVDEYQLDGRDTITLLSVMGKHYLYQSSNFFDLVGSILNNIAVMTVLALIYRSYELQPILAAGIPVFRLMVPFLYGTMLVNAGLVLNQELLFPQIASHLVGRNANEAKGHAVEPVYDYYTHIHFDGESVFLPDRKLQSPHIVLPTPTLVEELTTLKAPEAVYFEKTDESLGGWLLKNVTPKYDELSLTDAGKKIIREVKAPEDLFIVSDVSIDQLSHRSSSFKFLSTMELIRRVKNPSTAENSAKAQVLHLHGRLTRPILNLAVVFIVVPLVIRKESRNLIINLGLCALVLILAFVLVQFFLHLGQQEYLKPELAAWAPIIIIAAMAAWMSDRALT